MTGAKWLAGVVANQLRRPLRYLVECRGWYGPWGWPYRVLSIAGPKARERAVERWWRVHNRKLSARCEILHWQGPEDLEQEVAETHGREVRDRFCGFDAEGC